MDGSNHAIVRLVSALAAQLVGAAEVVLLLCGAIEDGPFPDDHDSARETRQSDPPDVSDDQCVQNVTVSVEDVESKSATALRVLVDVVLHQLHTLHRIHDAKLIHCMSHHLTRLLIRSLPLRS